MDIKQLKYFLTIAEEGQITSAAKRLHIAQPPLSQQLKALEIELDTQLVERGSRKIKLTVAGEALRKRAEQILELLEITTKELKDLKEGFQGTLSIGTVASSGVTLLPERMLSFHQAYPEVDFNLWEGDTQKILELLNSGVIEIGIVRFVPASNIYQKIHLPNEPMVVALSSEIDCFKGEDSINLVKLANNPFLLHRRLEKMIVDYCEQSNFKPRILCTGDDVRSLLVWADLGMGIAIVPRSAIGLIPSKNLIYKEIIDPPLEISKAIIWMSNRPLSTVAQRFLETFKV